MDNATRVRQRRQARIREVARELLGYERLRPGQADAIGSVLEGRDTLVVLATGQGKSAIYQLAGMQLEGPTIVISPLLALQRDQVASIKEEAALGEAFALNSETPDSEREEAYRRIEAGEIEFLFLAPEQLANPEVLERIAAAEPSLFVVDEAHCVTDWGHDFRPAYLRLGAAVDALGGPVILALTATASPPIRDEILRALGMEDPAIIVREFDRPNIRLQVIDVLDEREKQSRLIADVTSARGTGIVYAATRAGADSIAETLIGEGVKAAAYHAGLSAGIRSSVESQFMANEINVVVATIAFGMGIDKPDIRYVIHHDISGSLDAYYQEIGRAGRDGLGSDAILYYQSEDLGLRHFFAAVPQLEPAEIETVLELIRKGKTAEDTPDLSAARFRAAVDLLAKAGFVDVDMTGRPAVVGRVRVDEAIAAALEVQERRTQFERTRLEMLRGYAETRSCRREYLLTYFGDQSERGCGNCDSCLAAPSQRAEDEDATESLFAAGDRVMHTQFGAGQVLRLGEGKITVLFDDAGYRTLALELLTEGMLTKSGEAPVA